MPSPTVVTNFNVFGHMLTKPLPVHHSLVVDCFHFHGMEEAFHASVVPAVAFTAHTLTQLIHSQPIPVGAETVLASLVTVAGWAEAESSAMCNTRFARHREQTPSGPRKTCDCAPV